MLVYLLQEYLLFKEWTDAKGIVRIIFCYDKILVAWKLMFHKKSNNSSLSFPWIRIFCILNI